MKTTKAKIPAARLKWLKKITLKHGSHKSRAAGVCALEAVAYLAGEPHSDHPTCASPVISAFMRRWNDDLDDAGRQMLKPHLPRLLNTKASAEVESRRAWLATDWIVRYHTPAWLEFAGCTEQATALRELPEITAASCAAAQPVLYGARQRAAAAWAAAWAAAGDAARYAAWAAAGAAAGDAARYAAWDAAGAAARYAAEDAARAAAGDAAEAAAEDAARAAAGDAAGDAARYAAWDAARYAAEDAARAAARDAARDAARAAASKTLEPTKLELQASALDLLTRMIDAN